MINFHLTNIEEILPAGTSPDLHISWFWLTDANLWLKIGDSTIYEYSDEAMEFFESKSTRYNDYPLIRFIEDLTALFGDISESVPDAIWKLSENLDGFHSRASEWLEKYDTDDENVSDFYFNEYNKLINWATVRTLNSGHLIGGPELTFIRHEDQLRVIWSTDAKFENGEYVWKFRSGFHDIKYADFIKQVKLFRDSFFDKMSKQVELAIKKDWGSIELDKSNLSKEHFDRRLDFDERISVLVRGSTSSTNWIDIMNLFDRMNMELNQ